MSKDHRCLFTDSHAITNGLCTAIAIEHAPHGSHKTFISLSINCDFLIHGAGNFSVQRHFIRNRKNFFRAITSDNADRTDAIRTDEHMFVLF